MIQLANLNLNVSDVTGQRHATARAIPADFSVGQVIDGLLPQMQLNRTDRSGNPVQFDARLDREGRHLHRSERVGDALRPNDEITLHPRIMAGGR